MCFKIVPTNESLYYYYPHSCPSRNPAIHRLIFYQFIKLNCWFVVHHCHIYKSGLGSNSVKGLAALKGSSTYRRTHLPSAASVACLTAVIKQRRLCAASSPSCLPARQPPALHPRSEVDEMLERMSVNAKLSGQAWPDNVGGQRGWKTHKRGMKESF